MSDHHHSQRPSHDHTDDTDDTALAELLDLDAEVLGAYWTDVLSWVRTAITGSGPRRILDLGAGTGAGTIALARCFDGVDVVAVDASEEMLRRIRAKARDLGLVDRIHPVQADLDVVWPPVDPVDLTWASMSLHHLADPDRVLGNVSAATRPGGLVAVVEFSEPLRFLPHDLGIGRPGLEQRCLDLLREERAHALPELGSDWPPRLEAAGLPVLAERTFTIDVSGSHPPSAVRYAQLWLRRLRAGLGQKLADDDQETLAILIDGNGVESLPQRGDLRISGSRTVTLARRPELSV